MFASNAFTRLSVFFSLLLAGLAWAPTLGATADYMTNLGERYYKTANYENAANCFASASKQHPGSAYLHYMRGNALVALHRNVEAAEEYAQASSLDPLGQVGIYSKQALARLSQTGTGEKPRSMPATQASAASGQRQPAPAEPSDLEKQIAAERDAKIKQINSDTQEKIWQVEQEKNDRLAGNGEKAYRMVTVGYGPNGPISQPYAYYDPSDANDQVNREYALKEDVIRGDAEKRIADLRTFYDQKLAAAKTGH